MVLCGVLGYNAESKCSPVQYNMTLSVIHEGSDRLAFQASAVIANTTTSIATETPNRIFLQWEAPEGESYHGFGHQYSVWDLRGRRVPIMTTEQGVGRGLQPLTAALNTFSNGSGGNWHTTYTATPAFVTNSLWGMIIHNTEPAVFDLDSDKKNVAEVSVVNSGDSANSYFGGPANNDFADSASKKRVLSLRGELLFAATPLGAIKTISDVTGVSECVCHNSLQSASFAVILIANLTHFHSLALPLAPPLILCTSVPLSLPHPFIWVSQPKPSVVSPV